MPPARSLPEPLRGNETGTFTHYSVAERLPEIAARVIAENDLAPQAAAAVTALADEIGSGSIHELAGIGPQQAEWHTYVAPFRGQGWLDVPWFFAELYFYRRILDAIDYWEHGRDPYQSQKELGLEQAIPAARSLLAEIDAAYATGAPSDPLLIRLMDAALWGNQVDLSLWPTTAGKAPQTSANADRLLADDRLPAVRSLHYQLPPPRVDIVLDNAGSELVADLLLADLLMRADLASRLQLHAKQYPVFVSDATTADVATTIARLGRAEDRHLRSAGERLQGEMAAGRLVVTDHPYWVTPLGWSQRPADLDADLAESGLVVVKGDANFRRLLDDRHWEFTTPFAQAMGSTPAPVLALRTLKSELAAGLAEQDVLRAAATDDEWLRNGMWAVALYVAA